MAVYPITIEVAVAVTYFRARIDGPELVIEDAVAHSVKKLFQTDSLRLWTGGSIPLGAGHPDLVVVAMKPNIAALAYVEMANVEILAYLRAVGRAGVSKISQRTGLSAKATERSLDSLSEIDAVDSHRGIYAIDPGYRDVLPEIVTIEAKVSAVSYTHLTLPTKRIV